MINYQFCKIACLSVAAIFCVSGQSPRKEIHVIPATEQITRQAEIKKEVSNPEKKVDSNRRKSAAQRSMEAESQAAADPKSAAQKSMDLERNRVNRAR
jgi:hypothetical protein